MIKHKIITANHLFLGHSSIISRFHFVLCKVSMYGKGEGREVNRYDPFGSSELSKVCGDSMGNMLPSL